MTYEGRYKDIFNASRQVLMSFEPAQCRFNGDNYDIIYVDGEFKGRPARITYIRNQRIIVETESEVINYKTMKAERFPSCQMNFVFSNKELQIFDATQMLLLEDQLEIEAGNLPAHYA